MHPSEEKSRLRQSIKERLARLPEPARHAESRSLCRRLLDALPKEPITVCGYFPLKDEADLRPALLELFKRGCSVYLPCYSKEENALTFRRAADLSDLPAGAFKIPEPPADAELLDPATLDYALIPGRAFTRDGLRAGRGNGGYDKWIRKQRTANPRTTFFGIALECQLVNHLPMEAHDERVDAVVTAREILSPRPVNDTPAQR